jgi:hypothetical protein
MAEAAKLATGESLPRSTFSGGKETNNRLKELGFTIELKAPGMA